MNTKYRLDGLTRIVLVIFGIYLSLTLIASFLVAPFIDYACKVSIEVTSVFIVLPLSLIIIIFLMQKKANENVVSFLSGHINQIGFLFFLLAILAQVFFEYSAGFQNGWDVEVLTARARGVTDLSAYSGYLSQYPNQLFLFGLYCKIASLGTLLSIDPYKLLVLVSCLCVDISVFLIYKICVCLFGALSGLKFQFISFFFVCLSPWVLVPYSDTFGMLFTSLIIWCFILVPNQVVSLLLIAFFTIIGYKIKPTVIFVSASIFLMQGFLAFFGRKTNGAFKGKKLKQQNSCMGKKLVAIICGVVIAIPVCNYVSGSYVSINNDASYGMTHFLAMGINPTAKGVYSVEENIISSSISNPNERKKAQIQLWQDHLSDLGPVGLSKLLFKKNMTNYADGTFAWKQEGGFFSSVSGKSKLVRSWFGITSDEAEETSSSFINGERCFRLISHSVWISVLVLDVIKCLRFVLSKTCSNSKQSQVVATMALSLIMLSGFLLIFECRARYLFLYVLFYIAIAISEASSEAEYRSKLGGVIAAAHMR